MRSKALLWGLVLVILMSGLGCQGPEPADLVLRGGKVATVDADFTLAEAVAVQGEKIIWVGKDKDADRFIGPDTQVIDLNGKLVLPGLVDAHAHIPSLGEELTYLNVTGTRSFAEIVEKVRERVKEVRPGEWIVGGRWDHNDWEDKTFPVHDALSRVSPDNPVFLNRVDGNSGFANLKAMELAGITKDTPDPFGGVIIRKENGEPTGTLINRAQEPVVKLIPKDTPEQYRAKMLAAVESCLAVGLTGVHDAGIGPQAIAIYKDLVDKEQLGLRIYGMLGDEDDPEVTENIADYLRQHRVVNYGGHHYFTVRSVKLYFDGALGSRGAAFFEPYADDSENSGLLRITPEYIYAVAKAGLESGMQICTHCIGIRGNRLCLDAYEKALSQNPTADHRFRIEHAQIVRTEDVKKFKDLGVIPAMQPTHCTSDMYFVEDRIGKARAAGAYAWRWYIDAGLVIPSGSDFPVESNDPLLGIYAAVTRQDVKGWPEGGWFPEQRMTMEEAIRSFTIWAAYSAFQEDVLGSIEIGKYADFTILDKDIVEIEPKEILNTKVVYTIVGGKIRYAAGS